jgi:hypothetical protein
MYCTRRQRSNNRSNPYSVMIKILFRLTVFVAMLALIVTIFGDHVTSAMGTAAGVLVGNLIYFKLLHKP